ncbi:MAG TPA: ribosome maturation factor RimP [Pantanalinema sp.]
MSRIAEQVTELARPIAESAGVELFDVEYLKEGGNWILRITIDSEAGISHAECETVSRALDEALDAQPDLVPSAYMLEVSSPGAERPLRSQRDFDRFKGRKVLIKTYAPVGGKKEWTGELLGATEAMIRIKSPEGEQEFSKEQVSLVRLTID